MCYSNSFKDRFFIVNKIDITYQESIAYCNEFCSDKDNKSNCYSNSFKNWVSIVDKIANTYQESIAYCNELAKYKKPFTTCNN